MKKLIPVLLLMSTAGNFLAHADSKEKAIELMNALEIRKNIDASMAQVMSFSERMIESQNLAPEVESAAKATSKLTMQATIDAMNAIQWEAMFADIYATVFSEEEIQGLIDFYHSPLGMKLLEKQPELMAATMQKMQVEMAKFMPQIQQAAIQAVEQAKAKSGENP